MAKLYHLKEFIDYEAHTRSRTSSQNEGRNEFETRGSQFSIRRNFADDTVIWKTALQLETSNSRD
jgi:hypothetical protein